MLRKVLQLVSLASLAGLSLLYPLIESLDNFDSLVPASDLEIEVIVLLTFVGIVFVLAHLLALAAICWVVAVLHCAASQVSAAMRLSKSFFTVVPSPSPPLPLRI